MISFETASGENTVCSQRQWSLTQVGMNSNLPGSRYPLVPKFYIWLGPGIQKILADTQYPFGTQIYWNL